MRILIVDRTAEGQAACARRIETFSQSDVEMLDLRVKLVLDRDYAHHVHDADVLILGAGLGDDGPSIARSCRAQVFGLHIIAFVSSEAYQKGSFRAALDAGVRKVLSDSSSPLDLLQELTSIYAEFRREGRIREGRVVCVVHAKGGTGATTISAALGEVCSVFRRRTLLWDLDVETRDLCRSLAVSGVEARVVSSWINGSMDITRDSLEEALVPVSEDVSVLMPPDSMAEAMDLVCHTDGMAICQRVLELAKVTHDTVIIDSGGRLGPATGTLMRLADEVIIVIDDTVLGLTALDMFLTYVKALVVGTERISLLVNGFNGAAEAIGEIQKELEPVHGLGSKPWRLPPIPIDARGSLWPGSGKTLYSMGERVTRASLEQVAHELGLITRGARPQDVKRVSPWWERLLTRQTTEGQGGLVVSP